MGSTQFIAVYMFYLFELFIFFYILVGRHIFVELLEITKKIAEYQLEKIDF